MQNKIDNIEEILSHQEDIIEKLNQTLIFQQNKILNLEKKLELTLQLIKENNHTNIENTNTKPPHY